VRVLIADDQRSVSTVLATMVQRCGHEVVQVVSTGMEAIQAYSRHHPDVVLMDYSMPRLNGATACRNILAKDPQARIILISGLEVEKEVSDSGAFRVLRKPVGMEQLYSALYEAGGRRGETPTR
jgi:two-component system, chemotaxis family, chemotaxis protein CheY